LPIALPLFKRALKIREKAFGHNHLAVANSLSTMAFVYNLHNNRATAIPLYQEALEIREKLLGPDAPEVLETLYNLGSAYTIEREYGKAEVLNKRRLKSLEAKLGPDDLEVASALETYAFTLLNAGKEEQAKALMDRAQRIRDKAKTRTPPQK
jgi:tetratricopeptide (TPR) repeat protein